MSAHPHHRIIVCSCGATISQCRCIAPNKERVVVKNGCPACRKRPPTEYTPVAPRCTRCRSDRVECVSLEVDGMIVAAHCYCLACGKELS